MTVWQLTCRAPKKCNILSLERIQSTPVLLWQTSKLKLLLLIGNSFFFVLVQRWGLDVNMSMTLWKQLKATGWLGSASLLPSISCVLYFNGRIKFASRILAVKECRNIFSFPTLHFRKAYHKGGGCWMLVDPFLHIHLLKYSVLIPG